MKNLLQFNRKIVVLILTLISISFSSMNVFATSTEDETTCAAAILILPELPTYLTCAEAPEFIAPAAYYDNAQTGECENNGYIEAIVTTEGDECNNSIMVIYDGVDDFGNRLYSIHTIYVDSPPSPTFYPPEFPSILTCEEATNFTAPQIPYSNGLSGVCEISGIIRSAPYFWEEWDYCNGGHIYIFYDFFTECLIGAFLNDFWVEVLPAPPAEIILPELPQSVPCSETESITAPDAILNLTTIRFLRCATK